MIDGLLDLSPHLRRRLVAALRVEAIEAPYSAEGIRTALGEVKAETVEGVVTSLSRLGALGVGAQGAAAWLEAAESVEVRRPRTDLVWSGPEVAGLHARDTRQVYEELLGTAQHSLWISSFVYFDGPRAFRTLAQRMDERPELNVTLLLNVQRKRGDTTAAETLVRSFCDRFWGFDWPGKRRPRLFFDPRSLEMQGAGGVLHAKAVVADESLVFITSANMTEAALERNIEVGLLHRDRALALSLTAHFQGLITKGLLRVMPSA